MYNIIKRKIILGHYLALKCTFRFLNLPVYWIISLLLILSGRAWVCFIECGIAM
jgi:hypothetical protein